MQNQEREGGVRKSNIFYFLWVVHKLMGTFYYGLPYGLVSQCSSYLIANILIIWTTLWQTLRLLPESTKQKSREILGRVSSLFEKKDLSLSICVGAMCLPSHKMSLALEVLTLILSSLIWTLYMIPNFYIKDRDAELYHPIIT